MSLHSTSAEFFESMYLEREDPWQFASSEYERDRYAATLRALGDKHYRRAFEPGCSIGVLTAQLAECCDHVYAVDISPTAVARARLRCDHMPNVEVACGSLLDALPKEPFDLVVFSEIGYYLDEDQLTSVATTLVSEMCTGGTFLAVHWLGSSSDHRLGGDRVHDLLNTIPKLTCIQSERHPGFRLDRWAVA